MKTDNVSSENSPANSVNSGLATGIKPMHLLCKQSTTKCGYFLYSGGILIENTTKDRSKVTCKNCLRAR